MNENVGYLNLFFRRDKGSAAYATEGITDYTPALVILYNPESRRIQYANGKVIDFTGRDLNDFMASGEMPDDFAAVEKLITLSGYSAGRKKAIALQDLLIAMAGITSTVLMER